MFIHLGGDIVIRSKDVIAILDYDLNKSTENQRFLQETEDNSKVTKISTDLPKSIVITGNHIYYSPISSLTLKRRAHVISEFDDYSDN